MGRGGDPGRDLQLLRGKGRERYYNARRRGYDQRKYFQNLQERTYSHGAITRQVILSRTQLFNSKAAT